MSYFIAGEPPAGRTPLSRLDMADNPDNETWETPLLPLTYHDEVQEQLKLLFPLVAERELE